MEWFGELLGSFRPQEVWLPGDCDHFQGRRQVEQAGACIFAAAQNVKMHSPERRTADCYSIVVDFDMAYTGLERQGHQQRTHGMSKGIPEASSSLFLSLSSANFLLFTTLSSLQP